MTHGEKIINALKEGANDAAKDARCLDLAREVAVDVQFLVAKIIDREQQARKIPMSEALTIMSNVGLEVYLTMAVQTIGTHLINGGEIDDDLLRQYLETYLDDASTALLKAAEMIAHVRKKVDEARRN